MLVTVESANDLLAADSGGTSDPLVIVKCNGREWKTTKIKKNLNPVWSQQFKIPVSDSSEEITFTVEDHDFTRNDFLGCVSIPLASLLSGKEVNQSYNLLDSTYGRDKPRGKIQLKLQWKFDPSIKMMEKKSKEGFFSGIAGRLNSNSDDEVQYRLFCTYVNENLIGLG